MGFSLPQENGAEERLEFENIYFIQVRSGEPKIFGYITDDERQVLKERGLI